MTRRQLEQRGWRFNDPRPEQVEVVDAAGSTKVIPSEHRAEGRIHRPREGSVLVVFSAKTEEELCAQIESFGAFRATRKDLVATVPSKPEPEPDDGLLAA